MGLSNLFNSTAISGSGLSAERLRMEVAANNIANAHSTRTTGGGAYRRQQVVFEAAMQEAQGLRAGSGSDAASQLGGVRVLGVTEDTSPLTRVYQPGHPDADESGYVEMPNVSLPTEMIDLMTASRAYEANLKSLQMFRQMAEHALSLMRGTG